MKLALKFLSGLLLAAAAFFWATGLMDALFAFRSPLRDFPPEPQPAAAAPLTERLVFVLVDGLRLDTALKEDVMPALASLRQQGAWAVSHSRPPSYSQTGYTVLLTGAWPALSDGPAINLDYADIYTFTQDDLFSSASRSGLQTAISGYDWFEKMVPQSTVDVSFYTPGADREADEAVMQAALPWLESTEYDLVLIHLDQVDYAGHYEGGPLDPRWDAAARRVDNALEAVAARLDFSRDTLFLTSDHGHIDRGGHGGQDEVVLVQPFLLVGAGIRPGSYADVNMVDTAPTLAALLGVGLPSSAQGRPLLEMLQADGSTVGHIQAAFQTQQERLVAAYARTTGLAIEATGGDLQAALEEAVSKRLVQESLPRLALAVVALAAFGWLLWNMVDRNTLGWASGSVAAYWMVFHLKYAMWDQRRYTLSSVHSSDDIILSTAVTTALALLAAWLVAAAGLKWQRQRRGDAAQASADVSLSILFSLLLVVGWSYFRNGLWPTWTLPADFDSLFLGFLSLLQILVVGALMPMLSGLAALIGGRSST